MSTVLEGIFAFGDCDDVLVGSFDLSSVVGSPYVLLRWLFCVSLLELGVDAFGTMKESACLIQLGSFDHGSVS